MKLVSKAELKAPGYCVSCNSSNEERYVHLDFFSEFFGELYICGRCWIHQSLKIGLVLPEYHEEFDERLSNLKLALRNFLEDTIKVKDDLDTSKLNIDHMFTGLGTISNILNAIEVKPPPVEALSTTTGKGDKTDKPPTK